MTTCARMTRRFALGVAMLAGVWWTPAALRALDAPVQLPAIVDATVLAEALPTGFRVSAVALEYSSVLDLGSATIPASAFSVTADLDPVSKLASGPRTVTRVYTNDRPARAARQTPGRFIIVEVAPTDANSPASYYAPNSIVLDLVRRYEVRQVAPIAGDNETIPAAAAAIRNSAVARPIVDDFSSHVYTDANGVSFDYRQFTPAGAAGAGDRRFPLVLALHGLGSSGTDNLSQLVGESMAVQFALPDRQAKTPAFIIAPQRKQVEMGEGWAAPATQEALANLVAHALATLPVDPDRVYLIGLSMGSNGGWNLVARQRHLFAAAIQTAGYRVPEAEALTAVRDLPMWVTHGVDDEVTRYDVPASPLRVLNALNASGAPVVYGEWAANASVTDANAHASALLAQARARNARHLFTTYSAGTNPVFAHGSWIPTFTTTVILDWLFDQVRGNTARR